MPIALVADVKAADLDDQEVETGQSEAGKFLLKEAESLPQLHGRDAVGMCRHQVGGPEPDMQRAASQSDRAKLNSGCEIEQMAKSEYRSTNGGARFANFNNERDIAFESG